MHPPFYHVDHKIGPDIYHDGDTKPVPNRTQPSRLFLSPAAATGWPPLPLFVAPVEDPAPICAPSGRVINAPLKLRVVPPPKQTWRDVVGRFLIRAGQRMILDGRA